MTIPGGGAGAPGGIMPAAGSSVDSRGAGCGGADLPLLATASAGLARLDEALRRSSEAVRDGWRARALIDEAAASARLDDRLVSPEDLLLFDAEVLDRIADSDLGTAHRILGLLRAACRRSPRHLFTPRRLMALAGRRPRPDPAPAAPAGLPPWLAGRLTRPEDIRPALERVLCPQTVNAWRRQPALLAAADLLACWHEAGAADVIGTAAGRVLASAWPARCGLTLGLVLMPAGGFRGHAGTYRPGREAGWTGAFLAAVGRTAAAGLARLDALAGRWCTNRPAPPPRWPICAPTPTRATRGASEKAGRLRRHGRFGLSRGMKGVQARGADRSADGPWVLHFRTMILYGRRGETGRGSACDGAESRRSGSRRLPRSGIRAACGAGGEAGWAQCRAVGETPTLQARRRRRCNTVGTVANAASGRKAFTDQPLGAQQDGCTRVAPTVRRMQAAALAQSRGACG